MRTTSSARAGIAAVSVVLTTTVAVGTAGPSAQAHAALSTCEAHATFGRHAEQADFATASRVFRVPAPVLLAVSYLESRWDAHGDTPSSSGGYGPMNLSDGTGSAADGQLQVAARASAARLDGKLDVAANICGGAAVLAADQRRLGLPLGLSTAPREWTAAIGRYCGPGSIRSRRWFVHQVFAVLRSGRARDTATGQRVRLRAHPAVHVPAADFERVVARRVTPSDRNVPFTLDCPAILTCVRRPAPYVQLRPYSLTDYGNYDEASRPYDMPIRYIVIHNTGRDWSQDLSAISHPTWASWHYTVRPSDGAVAQHLRLQDVARDTGNWWFNMHSINVDVEGGSAGQWWTETEYESSAWLVLHLAREFGVPLDRAHIIGEDQVPSPTPGSARNLSDPGPFWDWGHFMDLLRAPIAGGVTGIGAHRRFEPGEVVTVENSHGIGQGEVSDCPSTGYCSGSDNFDYVRQAPDEQSALVVDPADPAAPPTTHFDDPAGRAVSGEELVVTQTRGEWVGVNWLGQTGWIDNGSPQNSTPTSQDLVPAPKAVLLATPKAGLTSVPMYGRAYPKASRYPSFLPAPPVAALAYRIPAGQHYVVADTQVPTDYFRPEYDQVGNLVSGQDRYDELWFGHRLLFVRAADVQLSTSEPTPAAKGGRA